MMNVFVSFCLLICIIIVTLPLFNGIESYIMNMKTSHYRLLFISLLLTWTWTANAAKALQRKQLFDFDWLFSRDSTSWRTVSLPHDWSVEEPFSSEAPAGNDGAYLPTGRGYYRKSFNLGREYDGKKLRLYFEGVYMNSRVIVNGQLAGGHPYGYSSFYVDITPYVRVGENTVEVSVDNSQQKNCRWYSGSGIYRHVWLLTTGRQYIDEWSVSVTTPDVHTVQVKAEVVMADGSRKPVSKTLHVDNPRLWSPADPYLYQTVIEAEGDCLPVQYGIRTIEFSAEKGLLLNNQPTVLNGACVHHDNGLLGAASYDAAEHRKVRLLKEAGFNAVRTSHNPPSESFLQACDELGLLVIDESFDGWREQKNAHDYHELIDQWWQEDLRAMVLRDRNHPSIFCWSIGNEVIERKKIEVVRTAHQMAQLCHQLDESRRPVTSALASWDNDWDIYDPLAAEHDIVGYNYMIHKAESDHQRVPNRVMMQTESYPRDAYQNYVQANTKSYVIGDFVWTGIDYLGESGIGRSYYEGEVAGEHWERPLFPWHAACCGDIDLIGCRKPISYYRDILWNGDSHSSLFLAVREPDGYHGKVKTTQWGTWPTLASWNWAGHEGKPIDVEVSTRCPKVRLLLNGQPVGEQTVGDNRQAVFTLNYLPGTLKAEGLNADGSVATTMTLKTAGTPAAIRLIPDHTVSKADGQDLTYIAVELVDVDGNVCPSADNLLSASVKGATLLAFGNADIKDNDLMTDGRQKAWQGRALVIVRSSKKRGKVRVTVDGQGLVRQTVVLQMN